MYRILTYTNPKSDPEEVVYEDINEAYQVYTDLVRRAYYSVIELYKLDKLISRYPTK